MNKQTPETAKTMNESVNLAAVDDLLSLAITSPGVTEVTHEETTDNGPTTRRTVLNFHDAARNKVMEIVGKCKVAKSDDNFKETVNTAINCLVKLMNDVIVKVNKQGGLIKEILENMKNQTTDGSSKEDLRKLEEDLQTKIQKKEEDLQKELKQKTEALEKDFAKKHTDLENYCDEGRQREMKGTIIVSSPQRGNIKTLAVHESGLDHQGYLTGENDLDLVIRMVQKKTGIRFPICDVVACHRIGKKESHSFVLKIGNRQPYSCWDALTYGMMTGTNFSDDNIFINFMLTQKRTEMSKQVRQLRKDRQIQNYSIDQNGKFYIRKVGDDTKFYKVSFMKDIENLIKKN